MDFRQLRYFAGVAELKTISLAAQHLRIAQPALSRCVKDLEKSLGVQLLNRHGRGVSLTSAGEKLYHHAKRLLQELHNAEQDVIASSGTPFGNLYLAMPSATGQILVPPILERYRKLYPQVSVHILEGFSGYIHEWLANGRIDVGVLHNPAANSKLTNTHLLTEEVCVIGPGKAVQSKLQRKVRVGYHVKDLAELPLILPSRLNSLRTLVEMAVSRHGKAINLAYEVDGLPIIKSMVERGLAYTVLTRAAVGREIAAGTLTAAPIHSPKLVWDLCVVSRRDLRPSEATRELIRLIREEAQESATRGVWGEVALPRKRPASRT